MRKILLLVTVVAPLLLLPACNKQMPETLVTAPYDEAEMDAAIQRARDEVDNFLAELKAGNGEDFAVKAPIEDSGTVEHFWLTGITFAGGQFTGTINNDPGLVTNVKFGQEYTLGKTEISDWMFMRDGKMHGNYTMRPLLETLPEAEAAELRKMFANP